MKAKKFLSLLLSLAMILTALPLTGVTAFAATSGNFEYKVLEDGTAEITDYTGNAETLDIPSKLDTYTVTSIGYAAFEDCDSLTSVTIPDSVTNIGEGAFHWCTSLTSVTIPNGVTSIGNYAFQDCDGLTSVTIPDSVISIGWNSFYDCDNLTKVTIPNSVTSIGEDAFYGCDNLTEIKVDVNNKNYTSQDGVLFNKNKTELIQYPIGNTRTSYKIPDSVISIGWNSFYDCDNLTKVTIPNSVTSIGEDAFYGCESLTEINVDANNKNYSSQDGVLFNKNKTELIQYPIGNERTSYDIPNSVTSIVEDAFYNCAGLTSVTIPDSVTSIGMEAFAYCAGLTSVIIPESVTHLEDRVFDYCSGLKSVKIPNSITDIDWFLFEGCIGLTSITIPESVTSIGIGVFHDCDGLTSVIIPKNVTIIAQYGFWNCDNLTDIYILNKECKLGMESMQPETTIHGYAGSTAEEYANKYGNKFVALEEHPSMEKVPEKAAACTEDGNVEYYHCSDCNKNFKDEYGLEEIADIVLKATGHNFENGVCTVCGAKEPVNPEDPTNPNNPKPTGEVSGDGKLSTVDAKWILQNIAKSREFSDEQSKAADLNGDGKLSVVDVKWVLQIIAGMRDAETLEPIK